MSPRSSWRSALELNRRSRFCVTLSSNSGVNTADIWKSSGVRHESTDLDRTWRRARDSRRGPRTTCWAVHFRQASSILGPETNRFAGRGCVAEVSSRRSRQLLGRLSWLRQGFSVLFGRLYRTRPGSSSSEDPSCDLQRQSKVRDPRRLYNYIVFICQAFRPAGFLRQQGAEPCPRAGAFSWIESCRQDS